MDKGIRRFAWLRSGTPATCATFVMAVMCVAAAASAQPLDDRAQRSLAAGQHVKVEGVASDGLFRASVVALRDADGSAKVEGLVESASADRRTLRVNGFQVVLDARTHMYRGEQVTTNRALLTPGNWLEAKGVWHDGTIRAVRIRVKDVPEPTAEIEGLISAFDPANSTLTLLDRRVVIDASSRVVDERTGMSMGTPSDRLHRDDDDGASGAPITFGDAVLGGRIEAGFEREQNYAVPQKATSGTGLSRLQLLASTRVTDRVEAYGKTSIDTSVGSVSARDVRVSEAYVQVNDIASLPLSLQVGRQRFRDAREWLFDDYLDAVRVHATVSHLKVEGAVARGVFSQPVASRARRDQLQAIASISGRVSDVRWSAVTVVRRDDTRGERPVWLAALVDRSTEQDAYWLNAAIRRGQAGDLRLRGWTFDVGVRHSGEQAWKPTLTIGYAFASGDADRDDQTDTRFRQTGLQDNQAYFGGLRRIALYGELFNPELSNLHVWTAAFGIQPRRGIALDTVFHEYMQPAFSASLPSSNLDGSLTGRSRRIGREVDVLLTLRARRGVDVDVAVGVLQRGAAFSPNTAPAFFWRPQVRFYF